MKKLKILHLCTDEKFIDRAINIFELVYPKQNIVCVYNRGGGISHIKRNVDFMVGVKESILGINLVNIGDVDILIVHSLRDFWFRTIEKLDKKIPIVWVGWGYDYYDLIGGDEKWLLKDTHLIHRQTRERKGIKQSIKEVIMYPKIRRLKCIERIQYFTPVIPSEYNILKESHKWKVFPEQVDWNYCAAEKDLSSYVFDNENIKRENILIGNSATSTNNHIEVFNVLKKQNLQQRKLIIPLNYGDVVYGAKIRQVAKELFADNADVLIDFMPLDEYIEKINSCGFVIMNHVRQQGVGNIVVMIYFGAKIFLREENPTFEFLKSKGLAIFTIQELEMNPNLLSSPLKNNDITKNRAIIESIWSDTILMEKTKKLISTLTK